MGHHHKAASCSAIPSFQSFSSVSSNATHVASLDLFDQEFNKTQESNVNRSLRPSITKTFSQLSVSSEHTSFPLPSLCLYSSRALADEYGPESDIIQFLAPVSAILEERLPMFVGVLQSLFSVVNDMPFNNQDSDQETDNEDEEEEEEDTDDDEEEELSSRLSNKNAPFTIIGLNTMKLVIWNNMYSNVVDKDVYENDLSLVIMVSDQLTDETILENMNLLRNSITSPSSTSVNVTANQIGEQLIPLVEYWFDTQ
ncbi:hypothetical protein MFLAVUS_003885 [Mucor flavus]|uniref:Uncharacterized protein n=1 Tax=Mucor flavus TaxID=439312 RepID=A0ABP9YUC6_9FUNG